MERLYSFREASSICGYKPRTLRQMAYDKRIRFIKTQGGHYRIPETEIYRLTGTRPARPNSGAVIYARVSSSENRINLDSQANRLIQYCEAKGLRIHDVVKEVASGINDKRPKLFSLLDRIKMLRPEYLVVEHKDRLARIGSTYIEKAIEPFGCKIDIVNQTDNGTEDLMEDLVAIITSFCARLYGLRRSKRKTEKIIAELKNEK